jgi:SulP family sulfate permease
MTRPASFQAEKMLPFLRWWPRVGAGTLRGDLVAGLTGAIIVLPQGVAFATIAGLPPQYGLYTAMVPAVIAALFGSSWHLVSGPTTAISIVVFSAISPLAEPGSAEFISLALTLTFLVGLIQLAMGLARMGALVNFISHTVVIGFTAGAAILIASSQLKHFFGVPIPRGASFYQTIHAVLAQARDVNPYVTTVGAVTLLSGLLVKRLAPRFPYMIAAMLVGSAAGVALDAVFGAASQIRTVGALPGTLPPLSHPVLSALTVRQLGGSAFAVTMLALTEAVSIARSIAVRSEQRIDGNQEFIGQGLANVVGSFFSSYASSGSFNRSGVNYEAGARTPLAAAFASVMLAAILLLVAPLAAYLPVAAMAGILFLVAWGLIDFHHIRGIVRASRSETAILVATFGSTLFLELEFAIYVGVILSLAVYLNRTSRPPVRALVPDRSDPRGGFSSSEGGAECPQLKIVEVHGSLFFGAIDHVQQRLQAIDARNPRQKNVLVVADGINFADIAGAEMLAREARRRRRMGGGLFLVGLKERTLEVLRTGGYLEEIGERNVFDSRSDALDEVRKRLDPSECETCEVRVFEECGSAAPQERVSRRPMAAALESAMAAAAFAEEGAVAAAREILAGDGTRPAADAAPKQADSPPTRRATPEGRRGSGTS